jgi:sigma-B regulation protein RsbU (phosphoserine phosphatase)
MGKDMVNIEMPAWLEQMEFVLETLNEGVVVVDDTGCVLFVNAVFEEMTGISRGEITGRRDPGHLIEDYARAQAFRDKTDEEGRGRQEFFLSTKDGGRLPVVISVRAMHGPEGGHFAIATLIDISEQKRAEEKLRAANARLQEHQREIEQDLTLATRVQQSLAPKPIRWGGLCVDTFHQPAYRIGGDFGLVTPFEEGHLNVLVCDVSGHGISSALIANRIYSETATLLGNRAPLADILRRLNSLVIQDIGASGFFFTLAAARVDRSGRNMEFAGAGHPPAMIVQPGAQPRLLPSRSMILGTFPHAVNADATLHAELEPGDRIVLYTDGITDLFDSRGEMLGVDGVRNIVQETARLPFSEMKQGILNRVAEWHDGPLVDDVSLVLVEVCQ